MRYLVTIYFDAGEHHGWVVESSSMLDALITFRHEYTKLSGEKMWRPYAQAVKAIVEITQFDLYEKQKS